MTDPQLIEDQAETIAERRQRAKERRTLGAVALAVVLLSAAPLWAGAVLGLAVKVFNLLAWGG